MKQYLFALAAIVAAIVVAFVVGVQYQRSSQPDVSAELRRLRSSLDQKSDAPSPRTPVLIAPGSSFNREELREEIRAALQSIRAADEEAELEASAQDPEGAGQIAQDLTSDMVIARDQATALIDSALKRGKWYADDRAALRRMADQIADTQTQFELFRRVSAAINDGSLRPELEGPLL